VILFSLFFVDLVLYFIFSCSLIDNPRNDKMKYAVKGVMRIPHLILHWAVYGKPVEQRKKDPVSKASVQSADSDDSRSQSDAGLGSEKKSYDNSFLIP
jgi:hypothetical protein